MTEEGCDAASTNRIAELAGVSIGWLYQYFPNKEVLIASLVEHHASDMVVNLATLLIFPEMSRLLYPNRNLLEVIVTNADNATDAT